MENTIPVVARHICKVYHSKRGLIMDIKMSVNRMFRLHGISQPIIPTCFSITTKQVTQLWHCRYEHLRYKGLNSREEHGKWVIIIEVSFKVM